jgi:N-acyl-D-amino-acid deacylase
MATFDTLIRGGLLIDGTGSPGRRADVGVRGDRIAAVGDLTGADAAGVGRVVDASGLVVSPGFVDPHGHSDASLFVDGALVSHLRQGFTTQLSGNCGTTVAPITPLGRELVEIELRLNHVTPRWTTFANYLDAVSGVKLGLNVAFLAGHGTLRGSVLGSDDREPSADELAAIVQHLEAAMQAGAFGLSSGLIYAPGIHARPAEIQRLVAVCTSAGGL